VDCSELKTRVFIQRNATNNMLRLRSLFVLLRGIVLEVGVADLSVLDSEIELMRRQIAKQRKEILSLQRAGASTASADQLVTRMKAKIDGLRKQRGLLTTDDRRKYPGTNKVIGATSERRFR
jgi:hypothetical protein